MGRSCSGQQLPPEAQRLQQERLQRAAIERVCLLERNTTGPIRHPPRTSMRFTPYDDFIETGGPKWSLNSGTPLGYYISVRL
jgi:hypothetical protein